MPNVRWVGDHVCHRSGTILDGQQAEVSGLALILFGASMALMAQSGVAVGSIGIGGLMTFMKQRLESGISMLWLGFMF